MLFWNNHPDFGCCLICYKSNIDVYLTCTFSSFINVLILLCVIFLTYELSVTVLTWWVAPPKMFCNQLWNCTHFRHPTDEQLRLVDMYFVATKIICSLSTLNRYKLRQTNKTPQKKKRQI